MLSDPSKIKWSIEFLLLYGAWWELLAPRGCLVVEHPTVRNLERHARPPAAFLLDEGELPMLVDGLEIVTYEEGWTGTGRHEARLLARR